MSEGAAAAAKLRANLRYIREGIPVKHRDTHYFLWFIFFGLISGAIFYVKHHGSLDPESTWLLITGLLGMIFGANWLAKGKFSRWYDLIIGIIFGVAGLIGIGAGFGINLLQSTPASLSSFIGPTLFFGLSLGVLPSLVHAVLGLTSLNHAIRNK